MIRRPRRFAAAVGLAAALGLTAGNGAAQPAGQPAGQGAPAAPAQTGPKPLAETLTGEAKSEYEGGKVLFLNKDYANALVKFQHAHELSKDPRLLWNMAICHKELRRYTRMLATLRRLLQEGGDLLTEEDRKAAAEAEQAVQAFVSPLRIAVNEAGASVTIDDEAAGTTPLGPQQVDVGKHKIRVAKPGFKDSVQEVVVAGSGGVDIAVTLVRDLHQGRLIVTAGPEDLISLDGKAKGQARWDGIVTSGGHTLRITAPGMTPYQSEVVVKDGETRRVQVALNALPQGQVARWLWIAGGAVLVTGAVIGGAVLFQPSDRAVPGTIPPGKIKLTFGGRR